MTRVLLGKDTETGTWFEADGIADLTGELTAGSLLLVATDGELVELAGTADGQTLVWNGATGAWEVSTETFAQNRRLLEEILLVLLRIRDQQPDAWYSKKADELAELVKEQIQ